MSYEKQPEHNLPWYEDEEGWYIRLRTEQGVYDLRPCDTEIYTHDEPYSAVDHIFHEVYTSEEEVSMGFRVWRDTVDKVLGDGAFETLLDDMRRRNFCEITVNKPTDQDMEFWERDFGKFEVAQQTVEELGNLALKNYDAEFNYYLGEGGEWRV